MHPKANQIGRLALTNSELDTSVYKEVSYITTLDQTHTKLKSVIFNRPVPTAQLPNKSLEQNALHASGGLLASQQPARRTPGVAQFWR